MTDCSELKLSYMQHKNGSSVKHIKKLPLEEHIVLMIEKEDYWSLFEVSGLPPARQPEIMEIVRVLTS